MLIPNAALGTERRFSVRPDRKKARGMMLGSGFAPNRLATRAAGLLDAYPAAWWRSFSPVIELTTPSRGLRSFTRLPLK